MLKGLGNVVVKEVKELIRDRKVLIGMIVLPLIMFPVMGLAVRISMETAVESARKMTVGVLDQDEGDKARELVGFLAYANITVVEVEASSVDQALGDVQGSNMTALIFIPSGFSNNISIGQRGDIDTYCVFRGTGIAESASASVINTVLDFFEQSLIMQKVPPAVLDPIGVSQKSIVKGRVADVSPDVLFSIMMSQYIGMPLGVVMLTVFAMQIAATAVASEKEEKTLETLLTVPINRFTILAGKLAGSVIVAAVGAVAYMVGVTYYMGSFTAAFPSQAGIDLASLGLAPTLLGYLVLGASLFVSLLSALALAIAISSFAEDVRSAQAMVGYLYVILFVPMILLMYSDISALPFALQLALFAIPYTHPMLAARAAVTEEYTMAVFGMLYVSVFTVVVLYIAARIFTTEKILTMRLRLRRGKPRREE